MQNTSIIRRRSSIVPDVREIRPWTFREHIFTGFPGKFVFTGFPGNFSPKCQILAATVALQVPNLATVELQVTRSCNRSVAGTNSWNDTTVADYQILQP